MVNYYRFFLCTPKQNVFSSFSVLFHRFLNVKQNLKLSIIHYLDEFDESKIGKST